MHNTNISLLTRKEKKTKIKKKRENGKGVFKVTWHGMGCQAKPSQSLIPY